MSAVFVNDCMSGIHIKDTVVPFVVDTWLDDWRKSEAVVTLSHFAGIADKNENKKHLSFRPLGSLTDVCIVVAVVGIVGKVDALPKQAGLGEAHVEALVSIVDLLGLGVLAAVEQQFN